MPDAVPGTLAEALAALQGRLPRVAKDKPGQAGQGRYLYADLTDCTEALFPLMAKLGLSFTCRPTLDDQGRFVLAYQLMHTHDGDMIEGSYPLPSTGSPQQVGGAITYARRYTLCAVTGLAPGGDDDDAASAEAAHHEARRQPRNVPDAQLAASGQMTRAQKADHERLAADTVRDPKRAERSHPRGPDPDDPWAQDAPVDHERAAQLRGAALTDPEDKPGSRLESQHRVIERLLSELHVESRTDRHNYVSEILHLNGAESLTSLNDLSYTQAAEAIRLLQAELKGEKANA